MKKVDFSYSFAPPNRLTVCQPDSSQKLLCDCGPEGFVAAWSEKAVKDVAIDGLFEPLSANHKIRFQAFCNGEPMQGVSWRRIEDRLPALDYRYASDGCEIRCEVTAGKIGDIIRVTATNTADKPCSVLFKTRCTSLFNRLWTQRGSAHNAMTGNMYFSPLRIVLYSPQRCVPSDIFNIELYYDLQPGESRVGFVVRPYDSWMKDVEALAATDWQAAFEGGLDVWRALLDRAASISLPDKTLQNVYQACLADLFVMREPQKSGLVVGLCGTEVYRCTNSGEALFMTTLLTRLGYLQEGKGGMQFSLGFIGEDGNWNEPGGWGHESYLPCGFKSLTVMEYYYHTRDRAFLAEQFERMLASARYNENVRKTTKIGEKTPEWGLMPRGMGDCGLKDGDDMYGVFYSHNFYCCTALRCAAQAAAILGRPEEQELRQAHEDYVNCILKSLEKGAVTDPDGVRWIGGVANKTSGSRWGAVDAAYPCEILPADHPLINGTIRTLTKNVSEGGLPLDLGWMKGGLWAAIAVDNLSYVSILRGETQRMMDYLYAVANHATPLVTWCEERMPEPQAQQRSGDLQHSWTPIAVCKTVLASMAFSYHDTLYLACGLDESWIAEGASVSVGGLGTYWGKVSFDLQTGETMKLQVKLEGELPPVIRTRGSKVLACEGCTCSTEDGWLNVTAQQSGFKVEYQL